MIPLRKHIWESRVSKKWTVYFVRRFTGIKGGHIWMYIDMRRRIL